MISQSRGRNADIYLKYSKPSAFYLTTKKDFFTANKLLLNESRAQNLF